MRYTITICDKCKRMISPGEPVRNHLLEDYCERCYKMADTGDMLLDDVYLTPRSSNVARLANIRTIKELAGKTMREMLRIKNCGRKSLDEFQELLRQHGLNFKEEG